MQQTNMPQDAIVLYDTTSAVGTGPVTWAKTGLTYINLSGIGSLSIQTVGTYSVTSQFQMSNDLVNWSSLPFQNSALVPLAENTGVSGGGQAIYDIPVRGWRYFRINISVYTSGTWTCIVVGKAGAATPATMPVWAGQDNTVQWTFTGTKTNNSAVPSSTNLGVLPAVANVSAPIATETFQTSLSVDLLSQLRVASSPYPSGATALTASSGNVANASAVATLAAAASQTTYITGFSVTAAGSTAGSVVTVTVAGVITGTLSYTFCAPVGALIAATPMHVQFSRPIPASATNTTIVVTCPALGAGNTNCAVSAQGFRLLP